MKINNLRSISLVLVWIVILTSACGTQQEKSKHEQISNAAAAFADDKKYKISWTMHQNEPVPEHAEMIRYIEDKFNVDLEIWNLENNKYEGLLDLRLAQGEPPDLFRIRKPQDLLKYQAQGVLAEIPEEMLIKHAPNIIHAIKMNAPGYMDYGKIGGKYYGIPVVSPTNIYRIPVVYRQDWLDHLGLKIPENLSDFEKAMYDFSNKDPDGNGKKDTYGLSSEGMNVVFGAFGQIVFAEQLYFGVKDKRLVIGALEPEMKEALKYLHKWYKDGIIDPEFITGENKGGYKHLSHSFINGKIGMTSMGNYYHWIQAGDYKVINEHGEEVPVEATFNALELSLKNQHAKIGFGQPVTGPQGKSGSKAYAMLMNFTAIGTDAAKEPGKMEKILQILDYISANPNQDEHLSMLYGVKGKHWKWVGKSNDDIVILPPFDKMVNYTNQIGANIGMTVPSKTLGRREQWASTLDLDKNGLYNMMEVSTPSLIKNSSELIKMKNKAYISIITGDRSVDDFDTFVKEFMEAGGEQVLKEANDWYHNHMKN
ncbi:extracellular solute-binding protein [Paenibacillus sedimenti]|uniref:Extracellular solute-binding protein n=1 Tax=Paenibacillus sedimenti TaxID=2770274 RepID=A0A926QLE7_9BACL|nr:extracellular solute-binding protein [Paenibacillus sedimenti]MBD0383530.1 extracellular solute-binding protein [Paenibacillus sedimenti]